MSEWKALLQAGIILVYHFKEKLDKCKHKKYLWEENHICKIQAFLIGFGLYMFVTLVSLFTLGIIGIVC